MRFDPHPPASHGGGRSAGVIVFDGDDTLWETEVLYDRARHDAGRVAAAAGFDPGAFEALQAVIDVRNVTTMGLSTQRFPSSSVEAIEEMARRKGTPAGPEVVEDIYRASAAVFDRQAAVPASVRPVLDRLHDRFRLALLTKGDEDVQTRRIAASGLAGYFDRIEIVPGKDAKAYRLVLDRMNASPGESWSIGNSLVSDAAPALAAGMHAIWIDAPVWAPERQAHGIDPGDPRLAVASEITDVPAIVATATTPSAVT